MEKQGSVLATIRKTVPAGALGFSLMMHVILIILIGGVVIIEGIIPKSAFNAYSVLSETQDTAVPIEEPTETSASASGEDAVLEAPSEQEASSSIEVLTADLTTIEPSFTVPTQILATPKNIGTRLNGGGGSGSGSGSGGGRPGPKGIRSSGSLFGSKGAEGDALVGYFYDLKQTQDKIQTDIGKVDEGRYSDFIRKFVQKWNPDDLSTFYKAPDPLSTYQIFIPSMAADEAPKAFNVEKNVAPRLWLIHYKGSFISPKSGTFRFVGIGDDVLVVRLDGKNVFDGSLYPVTNGVSRAPTSISVSAEGNKFFAGDWFNLSENATYPLEVLIGERPGGYFYMFLLVEERSGNDGSAAPGQSAALPLFQMVPAKIPVYTPGKNGPALTKQSFTGKE